MRVLTQHDLASTGCSTPGCTGCADDELYLHGACHPGAGTIASYNKQTGVLTVVCHKCKMPIAGFHIAEGPDLTSVGN